MFEVYEDCHYCDDCINAESDKDQMAEFAQGLINQLYGFEEFGEEEVENCLDELAGYFGLKLPKQDLQVKSKKDKIHSFTPKVLEQWKVANNEFLKSLV